MNFDWWVTPPRRRCIICKGGHLVPLPFPWMVWSKAYPQDRPLALATGYVYCAYEDKEPDLDTRLYSPMLANTVGGHICFGNVPLTMDTDIVERFFNTTFDYEDGGNVPFPSFIFQKDSFLYEGSPRSIMERKQGWVWRP